PYYPAVNSTNDPLISKCTNLIIQKAKEKYNLIIQKIHYFNGICDLSYVNYNGTIDEYTVFEDNSPVWGETYSIPFNDMQKLQAPVLNLGPYGKDPHKRTERLHKRSAFVETRSLLEDLIRIVISEMEKKN